MVATWRYEDVRNALLHRQLKQSEMQVTTGVQRNNMSASRRQVLGMCGMDIATMTVNWKLLSLCHVIRCGAEQRIFFKRVDRNRWLLQTQITSQMRFT